MTERNEHPEDVKSRVRRTGVTLADLARRNGVSTSAVRKSLYTPIPSGNRIVAAYLGTTLHALWPKWYREDGSRKTSHPRKIISRQPEPVTVKKTGLN